MSFEMEKTKIINTFVKDLQSTIHQLEDLFTFLGIQKGSSVSNLNPLEAKISGILASYAAKEYQFKKSLIALYKKYNRPHTLELNEILESKETDLKAHLIYAKLKVKEIYDEILDRKYNVDPSLLKEFLDLSLSLDFAVLQKSYQDMANNNQPTSSIKEDVKIKKTVMAALKKVIASWD
jgi:hypothetical protein